MACFLGSGRIRFVERLAFWSASEFGLLNDLLYSQRVNSVWRAACFSISERIRLAEMPTFWSAEVFGLSNGLFLRLGVKTPRGLAKNPFGRTYSCIVFSFRGFLLYYPYDFRRVTQNHIRARHPAKRHLQGAGAFPKLHERAFERKKRVLIGFAGETVRFFASRYKTC